MMHRIVTPETEAEMAAFDRLCWDYRSYLLSLPRPDSDVVRTLYSEEVYRDLLAKGATHFRPPAGQMRLAFDGDVPVGCGTVQTLTPEDAEIKRVYVTPEARGTGLARALMDQLVADCRALGCTRILMDTGRLMVPAQRLYDRMGFRRRGPYQELPPVADGILVFFEMDL
ncbi:GNAT family N-acetyltransferase [Lutimaribacter marinistellae]|uniref:GNAT family N-acetyltransferase n=1 Tax=Lutimaribacter marinistellae TaxID=1820329 RepID=A0ABV7TLJ0_9RHOB